MKFKNLKIGDVFKVHLKSNNHYMKCLSYNMCDGIMNAVCVYGDEIGKVSYFAPLSNVERV